MTEILKDFISLILYGMGRPFRPEKPVVLVYHSVEHIPAAADPLKLNVSPELFEWQMAQLAQKKIPCLITFDDGYGGVYTHAFPIVQRYCLPAILFLATAYLDGKRSFQGNFARPYAPSLLTWEQVKQMADQGMELGSHSLTHRNLARMDEATLLKEVRGSRQRIEEATGHRVEAFSYPYGNAGSFTPRTEKVLKKSGYSRAYVNQMGADNSTREPFRIRRIRVYRTDTGHRFRRKVAGAYNWIDALPALWPTLPTRLFQDFETGPACIP